MKDVSAFDKQISVFQKEGFPDLGEVCVGQITMGGFIAAVAYEAEKISVFGLMQTIDELGRARDRARELKTQTQQNNSLTDDAKQFAVAIQDAAIERLTRLIEEQFKELDFALRDLTNERQRISMTAYGEGMKSRLGVSGTWF